MAGGKRKKRERRWAPWMRNRKGQAHSGANQLPTKEEITRFLLCPSESEEAMLERLDAYWNGAPASGAYADRRYTQDSLSRLGRAAEPCRTVRERYPGT